DATSLNSKSVDPSSTSRHETASLTPSARSLHSGHHDAGLLQRMLNAILPSTNGGDLRTDLEDALSEDQSLGHDFSPEESAMLRNILRLRETRTEDVMVPRADIEAVDQNTPLGAVLAELRTSGHSRLPVFDGSLDQPVGLVHIKDVVSYLIDQAQSDVAKPKSRTRKTAQSEKAKAETDAAPAMLVGFDLTQIDLETRLADIDIMRPLLFVPASMSATDLMAQMQANRVQMALVIDEYGGTDGLISFEDLLETVVGDIEDEHDDEVAPSLEPIGDGGYTADARVPIKQVQEVFGDRFEVEEEDTEEVDTLGGLVFTALGRIPVRGELVDAVEGLDIEVTDADPRRIKHLKVYPAGLRRRDPRQARRVQRPGPANGALSKDEPHGSQHDVVPETHRETDMPSQTAQRATG
ncbi:MAG: hemolysin family protein, partial [Pseudomonadota bacterium]